MITLIVARAEGGAIGKDNTIPWHTPEDLKFFQRETLGGALIMGRRTWESLPYKPLKQRLNIVVSSGNPGAEFVVRNVGEAVDLAYAQGYRRVYGIGGNAIFKELMPLAHRMLITEVELQVDAADTFFPAFDEKDWQRSGPSNLRSSDPKCVAYEFHRLAR